MMTNPARFCGRCGKPVGPHDAFCGSCGAPTGNSSVTGAPTKAKKSARRGGIVIAGVSGLMLLLAVAYGGSSWYAGEQVAAKLQPGALIPLGDGLSYHVLSSNPGIFHSSDRGELVYDENGKEQNLLPIRQEISQGLYPDGSMLRIESFLPTDSKIYQEVAGPDAVVHWADSARPLLLQTKIEAWGAKRSLLRVSGGTIQQGDDAIVWSTLHGHFAEDDGTLHSGFHLQQLRWQEDGKTRLQLGGLHEQYREAVSNGQVELHARMQLGPSLFGPVQIEKVQGQSFLQAPQGILQDTHAEALGLAEGGLAAPAAWQGPMQFQVSHLRIDGEDGVRLHLQMHFETQDLASFLKDEHAVAQSPLQSALPADTSLQLQLRCNPALVQQALLATSSDFGQHPLDANQRLQVQQIAQAIPQNPLFQSQDGKVVLDLQASQQSITLNGQPLQQSSKELASLVLLLASLPSSQTQG
jgi:hypothetical protein